MPIIIDDDFMETNGALIYFNHEKGIKIWVYPQEGIDPHFILLDREAPFTTKKIGISLFEPKYIKLPLEREERDWILTEEERKKLIKILKKQDRLQCKKRKIWQAILHDYNWELGEQAVPEELAMPDYIQLPDAKQVAGRKPNHITASQES